MKKETIEIIEQGFVGRAVRENRDLESQISRTVKD